MLKTAASCKRTVDGDSRIPSNSAKMVRIFGDDKWAPCCCPNQLSLRTDNLVCGCARSYIWRYVRRKRSKIIFFYGASKQSLHLCLIYNNHDVIQVVINSLDGILFPRSRDVTYYVPRWVRLVSAHLRFHLRIFYCRTQKQPNKAVLAVQLLLFVVSECCCCSVLLLV